MRTCLLAVFSLLAVVTPIAHAATITVTSLADNTTTDGQVTLREAIQAAETNTSVDGSTAGTANDTIVFGGLTGTINLTISGDTAFLNSAFLITTNITITGTAASPGITLAISGGARRMFRVSAGGVLQLNNLTLAGGNVTGGNGGNANTGGPGGGGAGMGGAIFTAGSLQINRCTFTGNSATGGNAGGSNTADGTGGDGGGPNGGSGGATGGTNPGTGGGLGGGGGGGGSPHLGTGAGGAGGAGGFGGGGGSGGGGRGGSNPGGAGGAAGAFGGAGQNGGVGPFGAGGFAGGGAGLGGAIFSNGGSVLIVNSTFAANQTNAGTSGGGGAQQGQRAGGAIFARNGGLSIFNSTFSANTGGAVRVLGDVGTCTTEIDSNILANSTGGNDYVQGTINGGSMAFIAGGNNLIETNTGFPGGIVSTADPQLTALASNGGPTQTMQPAFGSPAEDTGSNSLALTTDQRGTGFPRVINGQADIGAVENPIPAVLNVAPLNVDLGTTTSGVAGNTVDSFDVDGTNLSADITITAPADVEIRVATVGTFATTPITLTQTGGTVASTTIEARIAASATGGQAFNDITVVSGTQSENVTVTATVLTQTINVAPGNLNLSTTTEGTAGSATSFDIDGSNLLADITITPPAGVEIRLTAGSFAAAPIVLTRSGGTVASTTIEVRIAASATAGQPFNDITCVAGAANEVVTLTGTVLAQPVITVVGGPLALGTVAQGTPSAEQSFTVEGTDLVADITVTPPVGVELATISGGPYSGVLTLTEAGGVVATTTVFARIAATAGAGPISGNITATSTGATDGTVGVTGSVTGSGGGGGGGGGDEEGCTTGTSQGWLMLAALALLALTFHRRRASSRD